MKPIKNIKRPEAAHGAVGTASPDEHGAALGALARALDKAQARRVDYLARGSLGNIAKIGAQIEALALKTGLWSPEAFKAQRVLCGVRSGSSEDRVEVSVSMDFGGLFASKSIEGSFDEVGRMIEDAALGVLMRAHPQFEKGYDALIQGKGAGEKLALANDFIAAAKLSGGVCARFAELCALEAKWEPARAEARDYLQTLVRSAASEGLLGRGFEDSILKLSGGLPGAPTWLSEWRIPKEKGLGFSGGAENPLLALPSARHGNHSWPLPELGAGKQALWSALCALIGKAHADGWDGAYGAKMKRDEEPKMEAAIERALIAEESRAGKKLPKRTL